MVELLDNWSGIDSIPRVLVENEEGEEVDVGHKVWTEGPCLSCSTTAVRPMTLSASYSCGQMMFSTYDTSEEVDCGLTSQELMLLYIILEIGVCFDEPPPPPLPID